ncbi:MAG: ABC transporter ATP-binding protein/permease [Treponema sp.]|nr:ABC transporter ATP-binding protein/permease [Treponema sp.]
MDLTKRLILMARKHWGKLAFAILGTIGASVMNLVTPQIVRQLTGALLAEGATVNLLILYAATLVGAYILRASCRWVAINISHIGAWNFVGDLTVQIYQKVQSLSMSYFHDKQTGQLMSRMLNDSRQVEILIAHAIPDFTSNIIVITGVAVMIFSINPLLAAITLIPVPFVIWVGSLFSKKIAPLFRINQQVLGELNALTQDNLSGIKEIQAFGQEERELNNMKKFREKYVDVNVRANRAAAFFHPGVEFMTSMGTVIVVGIGGWFATRGTMSVPDVVGFLMYLSLFYQPLSVLARLFEDLQVSYAGSVRVFEILDQKNEIEDPPHGLELQNCQGNIDFENVTFYYNKEEPVLKDVSFKVNQGQMVALVGPTGVGKTTIVSLMERFYDPIGGRILVDGHDIRDLKIASLRENISMVLQDVFLFNGSIAENIAYGVQGATEAQILEASEIACAHEFISQMPKGYQTLVGERGIRLSGGQKQRLSIARAVLRKTPILIFDEATSAVDTHTEAQIQGAIENLVGGRSIVVIAHRLSTIRRADQIIVLSQGEIVETGTYDELVDKKGGLFSSLSRMQWMGGEDQG